MVEVPGLLTDCVEGADSVWIVFVIMLCSVFKEVVALVECPCVADELVAMVETSLLTLGLFMVDVGGTAVVVGQSL